MEEKILYQIEFEGADALLSEMAKLRKENNELKSANNEVNKSLKDGKTVTDEQRKAYEANIVQIKSNNKELNTLTKTVQNNGKSTENMRSRLTKLRREMQRMKVAGEDTSQAYRTIQKEASSLQDSIDKVSAEIKVFADDALIMNTVVDAASGLAQGFQVVQSAQALLGFESEKFEQTMQKLVAVQSLINGLQGVNNMLQKQSRVVLVAKVAATKAVTAAQWAYNAALNANPIGIIITAIAALAAGIYLLIKNFDDVTAAIKQAWDWLQFWKDDTDEAVTATESLIEVNDRLTKSFNKSNSALEFEIKMLKALGAETDKIKEKERELLETKLAQAEQLKFITDARLDATQEEKDAANEAFVAAQQELQLFEAVLEGQRRKNEEEKRLAEEAAAAKAAAARKAAEEEEDADEEVVNNYKKIKEEQDQWERERELSKLDSIDRFHEEELNKLKTQLNNRHLTQAEYDELLLQLEEETRLRRQEANAAEAEAEAERKEQQLEQRAEHFAEMAQQELESDLGYLELLKQQQQELDDLYRDGYLTFEEYELAKRKLEKDGVEFKEGIEKKERDLALKTTEILISAMSDAANALGANFRVMQAISMAEAIVNTYKAASEALASSPPPVNFITAGLVTAAGLANVAAIARQKPPTKKMAHGGLIGGKPHSLGGTKYYGEDGNVFEAEKGEYMAVINKRDANRAAAFDAINSRHGVSLNTTGNYFARGGAVMPAPRQDFDRLNMSDVIREVVEEIGSIPVVNDVRDTRDEIRRVDNIERAGNL